MPIVGDSISFQLPISQLPISGQPLDRHRQRLTVLVQLRDRGALLLGGRPLLLLRRQRQLVIRLVVPLLLLLGPWLGAGLGLLGRAVRAEQRVVRVGAVRVHLLATLLLRLLCLLLGLVLLHEVIDGRVNVWLLSCACHCGITGSGQRWVVAI